MERQQGLIFQLDQQIALQTKILAGLQASYEVAFNRKTNVERMQLQNALLRRNVQSIEAEAIEFSQVWPALKLDQHCSTFFPRFSLPTANCPLLIVFTQHSTFFPQKSVIK